MSGQIRTPYFLVDEKRLIQNLELLKKVEEEGPCRILLAQKAFSMFSVYPLIRKAWKRRIWRGDACVLSGLPGRRI